jgi:hypothetical protein
MNGWHPTADYVSTIEGLHCPAKVTYHLEVSEGRAGAPIEWRACLHCGYVLC